MSSENSRTSALASRHRELGSALEDWNGMGTAWLYSTDPNDEHDAVRENVGMFDMSPLKKVTVRGDDARAVLDHVTTRDMNRIEPGEAAYLSVLTEIGTMADDAIVYNNGNDDWMIVHGSGDTMALLEQSAHGRSVSVELNDDLHDVSVQGPNAIQILNTHSDKDLSVLKYFRHTETTLFGHACRVSRTGYSGERGYEVFADGAVIGDIWDNLVGAGVMPCSFASLDKVRIEAGLLFYGYDMTTEHTPWEVGLGFTVSNSKPDFRGKAALMNAKGREKIRNVGLKIDHNDMVSGEEELSINGTAVGVVNSPCYSHRLGASLALAHVSAEHAVPGTILTLAGSDVTTTATIVNLPVYDPAKTHTHA